MKRSRLTETTPGTVLVAFLALSLASVCVESCGTFPKPRPRYDIEGLQVDHRENGYLVRILTAGRVEDIEAFVSSSNWLIVTIPGVSVDAEKIRSMKPVGIVREIAVDTFPTAVQISLKLSTTVRRAEVVKDGSGKDILIDLFLR